MDREPARRVDEQLRASALTIVRNGAPATSSGHVTMRMPTSTPLTIAFAWKYSPQ
jgi:hypothetical protein